MRQVFSALLVFSCVRSFERPLSSLCGGRQGVQQIKSSLSSQLAIALNSNRMEHTPLDQMRDETCMVSLFRRQHRWRLLC
jgi:hypothetical protein